MRFQTSRLPVPRLHGSGFTLTEVMVAVAVVGLISALVYPSYQQQLAKGRRIDARQALMALAQKMDRHHAQRGTYVGAALGAGGLYSSVSGGGHYSLSITQQTLDGFTLQATPLGVQRGDACASFLYNQQGDQTVSGDASQGAAACWR